MTPTDNRYVPDFDFREAKSLPLIERFHASIKRARLRLRRSGYQKVCGFPCIPEHGATDSELRGLETALHLPLPDEYRLFLALHRYLKIDDGYEIGGFDHDGTYVAEAPWVSERHREGTQYLVFANYWRYADGDQLMFDLSVATRPVIAYLHEHGPAFEFYAPSLSLALWRLVHE